MSDEGFHEIQLNGKQLVFLFMAATVVSVVIFLLGVMVGRGAARGQQATTTVASDFGPTTPAVEEPAPARTEPAAPAAPPSAPVAAPAAAAPEPAEGGSGYFDDLTKNKPGQAERVAPQQPAKRTETPTPAPKPAAPPAGTSPAAVTSGGYAVQIAALRDRSEADAIVKRLTGKGYQAFVLNPVPGKPPVYRVQVGRFADRSEAEKIAARLKTEEQFSPWVTR